MRTSAAGTKEVSTFSEGVAAPAVWQRQSHGPCLGRGDDATPVATRSLLPPGELLCLRPSEAGSTTLADEQIATISPRHRGQAGFTLIELLIVVAIMAIATAGVGLALRDSSGTALEREAQRLAVLLDAGRAQSRMTANPVRWRPTATGFVFDGLAKGSPFPTGWLGQDVRAVVANAVVLGPEPVIGPQQIRLVSTLDPTRSLVLATDGIRPFAVVAEGMP